MKPIKKNIELDLYETNTIEKLIQNNKVALILSNEYFYGWSTITDDKRLQLQMLFDPELAHLLLLNCISTFREKAMEKYGSFISYDHAITPTVADIPNCSVSWIDLGEIFVIDLTENGEKVVKLNDLVLALA